MIWHVNDSPIFIQTGIDMDTSKLVAIEMIFMFGGLLIFIVWQFVSLNRDNKKAEAEKRAKAAAEANATRTKQI
jgi:hypothetical protein